MNQDDIQYIKNKFADYPQTNDRYLTYPLIRDWKSGLTHDQFVKLLGYLADNPDEILSLHLAYNAPAGDNLDDILNEIDLLGKTFKAKPKVHRILLDSESVSVSDAVDILRVLDDNFEIDYRGDISLTMNASGLTAAEIDLLTDEGYNDFHIILDESIQLNEGQQEETAKLLLSLQESHSKTTELQLVVGFAGQTEKMITDLLEKIIQFHPTRIKLIPFNESELNIDLFYAAKNFLESKEWYFMGFDLFVQNDDVWFEAVNTGKLGLNSLGFRINNSRHVLGIGYGSQSFIADVYVANSDDHAVYTDKLNRGIFPVDRYYPMKPDDKIRKYVIAQLVCRYAVFFDEFKAATDRDFITVFADELLSMKPLLDHDLIAMYPDRLVVTESGEWFLNYIISRFDKFRNTR